MFELASYKQSILQGEGSIKRLFIYLSNLWKHFPQLYLYFGNESSVVITM